MTDASSLTEQGVHEALLKLTGGKTGQFVALGELAEALKTAPESVNPIARRLEVRGQVLCAPSTGAIVVICCLPSQGDRTA